MLAQHITVLTETIRINNIYRVVIMYCNCLEQLLHTHLPSNINFYTDLKLPDNIIYMQGLLAIYFLL